MLDDAGYAQADTVGGPIHTPTLSRIADSGVRYNDFNTTAICSSTRASLLTGRNQHRVGSGTITELASDFDGYTGTIPRSSATVAEVLKDYGRSEEHTSELQSLMRISYAVFCLKKKKKKTQISYKVEKHR